MLNQGFSEVIETSTVNAKPSQNTRVRLEA
jgi:hypothetical protein